MVGGFAPPLLFFRHPIPGWTVPSAPADTGTGMLSVRIRKKTSIFI